MASRTDATEAAVDEVKRRARRRLIGAIVLALAAAVILPMLLESDPKPFGEDVSIRIPPIDNGKFVNPLSPDKSGDSRSTALAARGSTAAPAAPADSASDASRTLERNTGASTLDATANSGTSPPASSPQEAPAKDALKPAPPAPATSTASAASHEASTSSGAAYVVQIGAFSDAKAADEIAAKLKHRGFPAYTEATGTGQGSVQRVRIGPYGSQEAASVALAQIKAAGYRSAIVSIR